MPYQNKKGKVTSIRELAIEINDVEIPTFEDRSRNIIRWSHVEVGDDVEYNTRGESGELIFLKVTSYKPKVCRDSDGSVMGTGHETGRLFGFGGGGEMANMFLDSQDPYELFQDGFY